MSERETQLEALSKALEQLEQMDKEKRDLWNRQGELGVESDKALKAFFAEFRAFLKAERAEAKQK